MDPPNFCPPVLPTLTPSRTKNILICIDGKAEYRDVAVEAIFLSLTEKYFIKLNKRTSAGRSSRLDSKIARLFEKMRLLTLEFPDLAYRMPPKPDWID
ncbi:MAG: hypothetical protein ACK4HV_00785 [Parachlamydiaceae bacterium]